MDYMIYVQACVTSFIVGLVMTYCMRKIAFAFGILDVPHGVLKNHKEPTPYLGGLAVYTTIIINVFWNFYGDPGDYMNLFWMFVGVTLAVFVGLYDDLHVITPGQKLAGQFLAVPFLLYAVSFYKSIFLSHAVGYALSFFFILSLMNAFNLIDVMDGLATTVALVSVSSFFCIALYQEVYVLALILAIMAGSLAGFLWWNKPAARIYLGDAGALLYGIMIAPIPFFLSWSHQTMWGLLVPLAVVAIPLLEVTCLIIIRLSLSLPPHHGSPHHFCHFLLKKGWSKVTILLWTAVNGIAHGLWGFLLLEGFVAPHVFLGGVLFFLVLWIMVVFDGFFILTKKPSLLWQ